MHGPSSARKAEARDDSRSMAGFRKIFSSSGWRFASGKACRPAVRAFDFDFNSRKSIRRCQHKSAENQMLHRINPFPP